MKINIFARVSVNYSGHVKIDDTTLDGTLVEKYEDCLEFAKQMGDSQLETFEGFKLSYLNFDVTLDRRKKTIKNIDILKSMHKDGLIEKLSDNIFGGLYVTTEELNKKLNENFAARRKLINNGKLVSI